MLNTVGTRIAGLPYSPAPQRNYAPVHLDVGGTPLTTTLSTLTSVPGSKIYRNRLQNDFYKFQKYLFDPFANRLSYFTGRIPTVLDIKTNSYFIDRDGEIFKFILQFLRDSDLCLPSDFTQWEALKREAEYWELNDLIRIIRRLKSESQKD